MKNNNLKDLSNEELLKKEKTIKTLIYILFGGLLALFVINSIYITQKGFSPLNIIPIALLPTLIINMVNLQQIKKEIRARSLR